MFSHLTGVWGSLDPVPRTLLQVNALSQRSEAPTNFQKHFDGERVDQEPVKSPTNPNNTEAAEMISELIFSLV